MNGSFNNSTAMIVQVEIVIRSQPDAATIRAVLDESVILNGGKVVNKVAIDLE